MEPEHRGHYCSGCGANLVHELNSIGSPPWFCVLCQPFHDPKWDNLRDAEENREMEKKSNGTRSNCERCGSLFQGPKDNESHLPLCDDCATFLKGDKVAKAAYPVCNKCSDLGLGECISPVTCQNGALSPFLIRKKVTALQGTPQFCVAFCDTLRCNFEKDGFFWCYELTDEFYEKEGADDTQIVLTRTGDVVSFRSEWTNDSETIPSMPDELLAKMFKDVYPHYGPVIDVAFRFPLHHLARFSNPVPVWMSSFLSVLAEHSKPVTLHITRTSDAQTRPIQTEDYRAFSVGLMILLQSEPDRRQLATAVKPFLQDCSGMGYRSSRETVLGLFAQDLMMADAIDATSGSWATGVDQDDFRIYRLVAQVDSSDIRSREYAGCTDMILAWVWRLPSVLLRRSHLPPPVDDPCIFRVKGGPNVWAKHACGRSKASLQLCSFWPANVFDGAPNSGSATNAYLRFRPRRDDRMSVKVRHSRGTLMAPVIRVSFQAVQALYFVVGGHGITGSIRRHLFSDMELLDIALELRLARAGPYLRPSAVITFVHQCLEEVEEEFEKTADYKAGTVHILLKTIKHILVTLFTRGGYQMTQNVPALVDILKFISPSPRDGYRLAAQMEHRGWTFVDFYRDETPTTAPFGPVSAQYLGLRAGLGAAVSMAFVEEQIIKEIWIKDNEIVEKRQAWNEIGEGITLDMVVALQVDSEGTVTDPANVLTNTRQRAFIKKFHFELAQFKPCVQMVLTDFGKKYIMDVERSRKIPWFCPTGSSEDARAGRASQAEVAEYVNAAKEVFGSLVGEEAVGELPSGWSKPHSRVIPEGNLEGSPTRSLKEGSPRRPSRDSTV